MLRRAQPHAGWNQILPNVPAPITCAFGPRNCTTVGDLQRILSGEVSEQSSRPVDLAGSDVGLPVRQHHPRHSSLSIAVPRHHRFVTAAFAGVPSIHQTIFWNPTGSWPNPRVPLALHLIQSRAEVVGQCWPRASQEAYWGSGRPKDFGIGARAVRREVLPEHRACSTALRRLGVGGTGELGGARGTAGL